MCIRPLYAISMVMSALVFNWSSTEMAPVAVKSRLS